jgi:hypothetical protein
MNRINKKQLVTLFFTASFPFAFAQNAIRPGEIWPDTDGNHIQAHGGGITKLREIYYWYGEDRREGLDTNYRYVSCYSSEDLINWKFRGDVIELGKPDSVLQGNKWVLERPKKLVDLTSQYPLQWF